jgi:hypothetical protein
MQSPHNIIEFLGSVLSNQALGKHNPPLIMGFRHSWGALKLCDVEYRQATMIYWSLLNCNLVLCKRHHHLGAWWCYVPFFWNKDLLCARWALHQKKRLYFHGGLFLNVSSHRVPSPTHGSKSQLLSLNRSLKILLYTLMSKFDYFMQTYLQDLCWELDLTTCSTQHSTQVPSPTSKKCCHVSIHVTLGTEDLGPIYVKW